MLPLADSLDIRDDDERGQEQKADKQSRQIAVALSYRPGGVDDAPKVVASGQGETARQILELAFSQGVRVREDPDLAQILAAVEIDSVIPLSAFVAVAEILSYVYRANNQPIPEPALRALRKLLSSPSTKPAKKSKKSRRWCWRHGG